MNAITPTATQSLGIATKRFVVDAVNDGSIARTHLAGRALLLGTAIFGTVEVAARLAMYCVGQVAALFTLFDILPFLKEGDSYGVQLETN